eukprot:c25780_g1_i1 orf=403-600(+)
MEVSLWLLVLGNLIKVIFFSFLLYRLINSLKPDCAMAHGAYSAPVANLSDYRSALFTKGVHGQQE